jgi:hypothetical protein
MISETGLDMIIDELIKNQVIKSIDVIFYLFYLDFRLILF